MTETTFKNRMKRLGASKIILQYPVIHELPFPHLDVYNEIIIIQGNSHEPKQTEDKPYRESI